MLGVVLWSDRSDRKAVFWCDDHADLAYFEATDTDFDAQCFFEAGDMVQFDVSVDCRLRKAFNAVVLQEQACAGLPETLKRTANARPTRQIGTSAKVIPFAVKDAEPTAPLKALKA
jgi:hypothetical protein